MLGTGRCGSTLVHEVLCQHEDVAFLSNLEDRGRAGGLLTASNGRLYRRLPPSVTQKGGARFAPSEGYRALSREVSPVLEYSERDLQASDATPWLTGRLQRFFTARAQRSPERLYLHKFTGWPRASFLYAVFPESRFVHVVRDGRAVANSWLQMPWWLGYRGPENWHFGRLGDAHTRSVGTLGSVLRGARGAGLARARRRLRGGRRGGGGEGVAAGALRRHAWRAPGDLQRDRRVPGPPGRRPVPCSRSTATSSRRRAPTPTVETSARRTCARSTSCSVTPSPATATDDGQTASSLLRHPSSQAGRATVAQGRARRADGARLPDHRGQARRHHVVRRVPPPASSCPGAVRAEGAALLRRQLRPGLDLVPVALPDGGAGPPPRATHGRPPGHGRLEPVHRLPPPRPGPGEARRCRAPS